MVSVYQSLEFQTSVAPELPRHCSAIGTAPREKDSFRRRPVNEQERPRHTLRENKKECQTAAIAVCKAGGTRQLQPSQRLSFNGPAKGSDRLNSHQTGRIRSFESSERFELARWKRSMETYQPKKVRNASVTLQPDCKQECVPSHYLSNLISLFVWPIFCVWTILDSMLKKGIVCNDSSMQKLANATREFKLAEREMHIASKKLQDAIALSQRVNARYQVCTCLNNFTF